MTEQIEPMCNHIITRFPIIVSIILILFTTTGLHPVYGDTLVVENGEKLIGTIIEENEDSVIFDSLTAGRLTIPTDSILTLEKTINGHKHENIQADTIDTKEFDWIKLNSGEWLKGEILVLQDNQLEFDSDKLDLQSFKWRDVEQMISHHQGQILLKNGTTVSGKVFINKEKIFVYEDTIHEYSRDELHKYIPGGQSEWDLWSGRLILGATLKEGNIDQAEIDTRINLQRRSLNTRFLIDYLANFDKQDNEVIEDNHRIRSYLDYYFSQRWFLRVPTIEYYRDPIQNLDYRVTLGVVAGYSIVRKADIEWSVILGPGYQYNQYLSVQEGDDSDNKSFSLLAGTGFNFDITKETSLSFEYSGQLTREASGESSHFIVTSYETELTERLFFNTTFTWNRINNPQQDEDGIVPESDDYRLSVGIGVNL